MSKSPAAIALVLGFLAALGACDSDGSDETDGDNACIPDPDVPIDCVDERDCPAYGCSCADGSSWLLFGPCLEGTCTASDESECARQCVERGGVEHAATTPNPTVVDSQECADWCARLVAESAGLGCGGIDRCSPYVDCDIPEGECSAKARERLACMTESAEFSCDEDESLHVTSDCLPSASCAGDPCLR